MRAAPRRAPSGPRFCHARACPGHPCGGACGLFAAWAPGPQAWMAGTSPAMTAKGADGRKPFVSAHIVVRSGKEPRQGRGGGSGGPLFINPPTVHTRLGGLVASDPSSG